MCYDENVLTAEMIAKLDECVKYVARHEYGTVQLVVQRGRARRVRMEIELSWEDIPEQLHELNIAAAAKQQ